MSRRTSVRLLVVATVVSVITVGCGRKPLNTPEEVFLAARSAFAEGRWERLFDTLPPATQATFMEQLHLYEQQVKVEADAMAATNGISKEQATDQLLVAQLGLTTKKWVALPPRDRFAAFFVPSGGEVELRRVGINVEQIAKSNIESIDVRGNVADVIVDDGELHQTKLTMVLIDQLWYLDLGYE